MIKQSTRGVKSWYYIRHTYKDFTKRPYISFTAYFNSENGFEALNDRMSANTHPCSNHCQSIDFQLENKYNVPPCLQTKKTFNLMMYLPTRYS
jgi:hypothetical protein